MKMPIPGRSTEQQPSRSTVVKRPSIAYASPYLLIFLLALGVVFLINHNADETEVSVNDSESDDWLVEATGLAEAEEYEIGTFQDAGFSRHVSPNRANDMRFYYLPQGFEAKHRRFPDQWEMNFSFSDLQVNGQSQLLDAEPSINLNGSQLQQQHTSGITVEYLNQPAGMRQNFIFEEGPKKKAEFRVDMQIQTDLVPVDVRYNGITFGHKDSNEEIYFYNDLKAFDANDRLLASHMEITHGEQDGTYNLALIASGENLQYPVTIDPLNGAAWSVEGNSGSDGILLGYSVAGAGDVNDDGYDDAIVGVINFDNGMNENAGQVRIYHGSSTGLSTTPAITINGGQAGAFFGYSVAGAGHVNVDNYADVIIGAYLEDESFDIAIDTLPGNTDKDEGVVYVFYGSASGITTVMGDTIVGSSDLMRLGGSVSGAGDVDNNGLDDIVVGAYAYSNGEVSEGAAYVYLSDSITGLSSAPDWSYEGEQAFGYLGFSVSGAGDVNDDSYADIIVGAYGQYNSVDTSQGKAYVFLGSASGPSSTPDWQGVGMNKGEQFGISVANAGNVNGDDFDDIVIGANRAPGLDSLGNLIDSSFAGGVYVYHGSGGGPSNNVNWKYTSTSTLSGLGRSVASAGDVDNNGFDDIIAGAPGYSSVQFDEGAAFAFYGYSGGLVIDSVEWFVESDVAGAFFGIAVDGLGDVNGDGVEDVIVGAYQYSSSIMTQPFEGAAFAFYGIDNCGLPRYGDDPVFLTFPEGDTLSTEPGTCTAVYSWEEPTFDDNCTGTTILQTSGLSSGSDFPLGITTVTYEIENSSGQIVSQSFEVNVVDTRPPTIDFCEDVVHLISPGEASGIVNFTDPTFIDNCSGTISISQIEGDPSGSVFPLGVSEIQYEATDPEGNTSICTFRVVVIDTNAPGESCTAFELNSQVKVKVPVQADVEFRKNYDLFGLPPDGLITTGDKNIGASVLFKIVEGVIGYDIPDWIESLLGVGGSGIDLCFVTISYGMTPGINMGFGIYNDLIEADSATIDINYPVKVCASHPDEMFFGCKDTITIATRAEVLSNADLNVTPGMLNQEFGINISNITAELAFYLSASACIGIPNPTDIGPDCLGVPVGPVNLNWQIFGPYDIWEGPGDIPFWVICDSMFNDGAGYTELFECTTGFGIDSELEDILNAVDAAAGANGLNGVEYDSEKDLVTLMLPDFIGSVAPFPLPEFDFKYGRLIGDELGATSVVGDKLVATGKEAEFERHRVDLLYVVDLAIFFATAGASEIPPGVGLGTTIDLGYGFFTIDLADLNLFFRTELEGTYEFDPEITIDEISLEYPMSYNVENSGWMGPSTVINGVLPGETIQLVIPDDLTDTIGVSNDFSATGDANLTTTQQNYVGLAVEVLELGGRIFSGNTVGPLLEKDIAQTKIGDPVLVQSYTLPLEFAPGQGFFELIPDMLPPIIVCDMSNDTTVYLNEWGYATIDPEDIFQGGYDVPEGGTGEVIIVGVEPDTVTCSDYPGVDAILITEDDNCNFDTCHFYITVLDTLKPYLTCQDLTVYLDDFGVHHLDPEEMVIGAIDNCSYVDLVASQTLFGCADLGSPGTYVTVTGTDIAMNIDTCGATITVLDTIPPLLECPFLLAYPVTRNTDAGFCTYTANSTEFAPTLLAPDCSTIITWELTGATELSGNNNLGGIVFNLGETLVTYTATDASGNSTVCSFLVIVIDEEDPEITCPGDIVISTNEDGANDYNCTTEYTWNHPAPTDNCMVDEYSVVYTFPDGSTETEDLIDELNSSTLSETRILDLGITMMEYIAVDTAGNTVMCSWTITVVDDEIPMVFCEQVIACNDYLSAEAVDIHPNDQTVVPIEVANDIIITDVNLSLDGNITDLSNLTISLQSPEGTIVLLGTGLCAGNTSYDVTFDDDAANNINTASCPPTGTYQSQFGGLAGLNGEQSGGTWQLIFDNTNTDGCGLLASATLELCGNDASQDPVLVSVQADPNLCSYKINDTSFDAPFTDNCDGSTIVHDAIMGPFDHTLQGATLPVGQTTVTWTVTDASGNMTSCTIIYEVLDTEAPVLANCPRPDIIEDAEPGICGAYVNFSLPLASDNCGTATVAQVDMTGLSTGNVFPVGMTILDFEATDASGNVTACSLRVIVNDTQDPILVCPQSMEQATDPWVCEAIVTGIAPLQTADNCSDNYAVVYQIEYPSGSGEITASGVADASGEIFQNGTSTVTYRIQDQPLLLITEVTHEIGILNGGMDPVPYAVLTGDDYMEITNLGPAAYNISELVVERIGTGQDESRVLPNGTVVEPGQTVVIHFGNGDDDPMNLFFNVPCASDLTTGQTAGYAISFKGRTLDVVSVNGYDPVGQSALTSISPADWSGAVAVMNGKGGVYRQYSYDTNAAADWLVADVCMPITIGSLNPTLEAYTWNGSTTALQSVAPNTDICNFNVVIFDEETPTCGEYLEHVYTGPGGAIEDGLITQATINVPDNFTVGDVDILNLFGQHSNMGDLVFKITSPEGTQVILFGGLCEGGADFDLNIDEDSFILVNNAPCSPLGQGGWYVPANSLTAFYGESAQGNWTLEIADTVATNTGQLIDWDLRLFEIASYSQMNTTLDNDPGFCGAVFGWTHPRLVDNCREGDIEVVYLTTSFIDVPQSGPIVGGSPASEYFEVGETIVRYILTDAAGNIDSCEFVVTVLDVEDPVVVCPNDIIIYLNGGECRSIADYAPASATDNCAVVDTIMTPPSGSYFEIGVTPVDIVIIDSTGNEAMCTFNVEVIEYVPSSNTLSCNDLVNISLDADCESEITADMILEGDDYHCYEDYEITVLDIDGFPIPNSPVVDISYVGQTLTVMVYDPDSGNTCWSEIYIEDHQLPLIDCPADTTVFCHIDTDPINLGEPILLSCEVSIDLTYNDEFIDFGNCSDPRGEIQRLWTVTDESGNFNTCEQLITIERISFADVVFPTSYDGFANPKLTCTDLANNPDLTDPSNTGEPTVDGLPITGGAFCSVAINYVDNVFDICEGSYDILRTWSVYDPCEPVIPGVNPLQYLQVIKVEDNADPILTCPANMVVNAGNGDCTANVSLPAIGIDDACSSVNVETDTPNGTLQSNGGVLVDVAIGDYDITYLVVDDCGNSATCSFVLTVEDQTAPVAVCDEITEVALTSDGQAVVFAETFDDGSFDNCQLAYFEVQRMDGECTGGVDDFGPSVSFCCDDVANNPIMVVFRAYDIYDNYNDCMVQVEVQDKLPPFVVTCPANQTIGCEDYVDDLALALNLGDNSVLEVFGGASFFDNCALNISYEVSLNIDECQSGTITRTWTADDNSGFNPPAICAQVITVEHNSDWVVEFPADLVVNCTDGALPDFGEPQIYFDECELIGVSFEDAYFYVVPDACYKVIRTWTAINWCVYEDFGYDVFNEEDQFEATYFADWDGDGDSDERTFRDGWNTSGTPGTADGYIVYEQTIKVNDTEDPEFVIPSIDGCIVEEDCETDITIPYPDILDDCSPSFVVNITGDFGNYDDISGDVTISDVVPGIYTINYELTDDCGNTSFDAYELTVEDCKLPTPYCLNGLVVEIMQTGMIDVWASDLNQASFDNCPGDLVYSFSSDVTDLGVTYTCDDLGQQSVEIWVTDAAGNQDFCETFITVQDNMGVCTGNPVVDIAGIVTTEWIEPVEYVNVEVNGSNTLSQVTTADGLYLFNVPVGGDYTITPMRDDNHLNGVTTYDLVLISMHILGVQPLGTPYKIIAADANNSGTVSTLDMVEIRKLILILEDEFPQNTSWRFVDANYVFPDPTNPWVEIFPEAVSFNDLPNNELSVDFIGMKIGDVNGTAIPNDLAEIDDRSPDRNFWVYTEDILLEKGVSYNIPFFAGPDQIWGYQYTLGFDRGVLDFLGLDPGLAGTENIGLAKQEEGYLTFSWNASDEPRGLEEGTHLFDLKFQSGETAYLRDLLEISTVYTKPEAYDADGEVLGLGLRFENEEEQQNEFMLYQCRPNPFKGTTTVGFVLPKAAEATFRVLDISGKELYRLEGDFPAGYGELRITAEDLSNVTGVLYYELSTSTHKAVRQMVRFN